MTDEAAQVFCGNLDFAWQVALSATRDPVAAEDAVQDAYLRFTASWPSFDRAEPLRPYLARTVINAATDRARAEHRRAARDAAHAREELMRRREPSPSAEESAALRVAVAALPLETRLAVSLRYLHELSLDETAAALSVPRSTASDRVQKGLDELKRALTAAGFGAFAPAVLAALPQPAAPAGLVAKIQLIAAGKAGIASSSAAAAAKGGLAVKIIVGVVAAGVLAGAVAVVNSVGAGFKPAPTTLASPPAVAPADSQPAPINEYKGLQEREEVFEFAQKPKVTKEGDKWIIAFTSKGKCDATVTVLGPDGKIVRHLASGVLGVNAPYPFQQNSLSQKVEWDGLTSSFKKAPAGCKVKVSLGLKPEYERNIFQAPHNLVKGDAKVWTATDKDGNTCVAVIGGEYCAGLVFGHVYDKAGKYVRTFWPPPAKDVEKVGVKLTTTKWGDKTPWEGWFGPFAVDPKAKKGGHGVVNTLDTLLAASGLDPQEFKPGPWPANLPKSKLSAEEIGRGFGGGWLGALCGNNNLFWVDQETKTIFPRRHFQGPINAETGEWLGARIPVWPITRGFDGFYYRGASWGEPGGICRTEGFGKGAKVVPFTAPGYIHPSGHLRIGFIGTHGGVGQGFDVTETGDVVLEYCGVSLEKLEKDGKTVWDAVPGDLLKIDNSGENYKKIAALGFKVRGQGEHIVVCDKDGKWRTQEAIENLGTMTDVYMDRDGNMYVSQGFTLPAGQKWLHGISDCPGMPRGWGGSVLKFRGLGNKYPLGRMYGGKGDKETPPADALKLAGERTAASGALWAYGGISNLSGTDCQCNLSGFHLDNWARLWLPNNAACGVMVVDSNGNFVTRVGRYGNADDTEADLKEKKDGVRFAYIRSAWATDEALYVFDTANVRFSKILLKYAAEEAVPAP